MHMDWFVCLCWNPQHAHLQEGGKELKNECIFNRLTGQHKVRANNVSNARSEAECVEYWGGSS